MSDRAQVETTVEHKLVIPAAEVRAALIAAGYQVPKGTVMGGRIELPGAYRTGPLMGIEFHWQEKEQ